MLPDEVWARHSNPKSGWTRLLAYPALIYAVYARSWRLLGATLAFLAVNPFVFPEPKTEPDDWMYRVVRAEQRWSEAGRPFVGVGFPQVINLIQVPVFAYNVYSAVRRRPVRTIVSTAATMALKLWFVDELVKRDDSTRESN
ncbi:DUF6653 family protein [Natrialbaceae archaeon GCM10025810]|uniref:DUF6653 family protein n=1 Tax=Halovalidus salilacus TaxID=3075124 RepID=UPI003618CC58